MADGSRGGGMGCAALAGLVAEKTSLHAVHDGCSDGTADGLVDAKGTLDDDA